jgi:hypothetical protein
MLVVVGDGDGVVGVVGVKLESCVLAWTRVVLV